MTERKCPADGKPCRWWQCVDNDICIGEDVPTRSIRDGARQLRDLYNAHGEEQSR